jgi:hypothetical protein
MQTCTGGAQRAFNRAFSSAFMGGAQMVMTLMQNFYVIQGNST